MKCLDVSCKMPLLLSLKVLQKTYQLAICGCVEGKHFFKNAEIWAFFELWMPKFFWCLLVCW